MGNDIIIYIQKLELFGFFSGYCLIYTLVYFLKGDNNNKPKSLINRLATLLPYAYALTATLYLGMVIKNISLDFSIRNFQDQFQVPFLEIWALLAVLFWIPLFNKKTVFSLIHSLVFFAFLVQDFFINMNSPVGKEIIHNYMKVFTDSLLLNLIALAFVVLIYFFLLYFGKKRNRS
ncbi:MAG TPA: hypothetical protein VLS85_06140 [Hanamia sp.]|nr:hypothetical protein [Hanamia sp.]